MRGLKTQETSKFNKIFSIVQDTANQKGCVFFLDAGDGRDFETNTLEGEDLMGWLIPNDKSTDFEESWLNDDISDDWSDYYVWAIWNNQDNPKIKFD